MICSLPAKAVNFFFFFFINIKIFLPYVSVGLFQGEPRIVQTNSEREVNYCNAALLQ